MNECVNRLFPELEQYLSRRAEELDEIDGERRALLESLAAFIVERRKKDETARLIFICTHNSRRSHMADLWTLAAARRYSLRGVETYSGGTEATAFNPRSVACLRRCGLRVEEQPPQQECSASSSTNPRYLVRLGEELEPVLCFSKVFDQAPNPRSSFCAVMTCSEADAGCPVVYGADERIAIPFEDPKRFDDTAVEARQYDERCRQIAREMLYVILSAAERVRAVGSS